MEKKNKKKKKDKKTYITVTFPNVSVTVDPQSFGGVNEGQWKESRL